MRRRIFGPGVVTAVLFGACGLGMALGACSSSSGSGYTGGTDSGGGGSPPAGEGGVACTGSGSLQIHFAPMYSAFVTDSTAQEFQVPAIVTGATGTATWSASPSSAVTFAANPGGGTLMTVNSASSASVTITAQVGSLCTSTTLGITSAVEADYLAGKARYNNGVPVIAGCIDTNVLPLLEDAGIKLPPPPDSGCPDAGPACTGCHGPAPTGGFFSGVEHTPEQTAGFTDQDLVNIFVNGTVEDGGAYNPSILPYAYWHAFHTWTDINTPEEQKGMVVYLRSLTPVAEQGGINFGGLEDAGIVGED